jgi:catechol 2,3-dioxygenase-like lactoylglutathione lyase family enzyme
MFTHIMLGADDIAASKAFYDAALGALGVPAGVTDEWGRVIYAHAGGRFLLTKPIDGQPASHGNGSTMGFAAASTDAADAWHAAGLAHGGTACEDPPGVRHGTAGRTLYLAYLRDPSGNKLCAAHRVA